MMKKKCVIQVLGFIVLYLGTGTSFAQNSNTTENINSFWSCFKEAAINSDTTKLIAMIKFPLDGAQSNVNRYDTLGLQKNEFAMAYPSLFNESIMTNISGTDQLSLFYPSLNYLHSIFKTDDGKYYHLTIVEHYEDEFGIGNFTTVLIFGLINNKYQLIEVSYAG